MLFIIVFSIAVLAVPIYIDIDKNGSDNILAKSGKEIIQLPFISKTLNKIGATAEATTGWIIMITFLLLALVLLYIVFSILTWIF
ncbi:hypothetical protein J0X14_18715 [Muricauda sp. CAU 1633]|uniref:hypothetical protein n=1 Tax=Allomuricauda sp. CAU 1633 TaxID=2816036 RepID=UPI001A8ECF7E|nr:hypothetical protein [Muricauda sp. CAU 1633]MBO0324347.1 hypothetical protein [Muricauda sp. CAU 1633]